MRETLAASPAATCHIKFNPNLRVMQRRILKTYFAFPTSLVSAAMAGGLPYLPTRILSSQDDIVYLFRPPTPMSSRSMLVALNTSRRLDSADIEYVTLSDPLPFLNDEDGEAFTPTIDTDGKMMAYAGKCQEGAEASTFWMFIPSNGTNVIGGTWRQMQVGSATPGARYTQGANYLASGMTFSSTINSTSAMFVFGGMCPDKGQSPVAGWIESANYSNTMLTIQTTSSPSEGIYNLSNSTSRGPPIPEAGFTLTPLEPTYSQTPKSQNRNQNFVLLGGHTHEAFINMSQVALFSLPEQAWSYLPVDLPPVGPKTDLTRDIPLVEPRSGHTAVLTPDGRKIIVFGGWVGDVASRATPQLAILELGTDYGGNGNWRWTIPAIDGIGPGDGVGIFGHGAVMLPGSVMMIAGGYLIPKSSLERRKRSDLALNPATYFLNTTSGSWIPSFDPPHKIVPPGNPTDAPISKTTAKKAGLQAGLTLGVLALLGLLCFYFWYSRRISSRRQNREKVLRSLAAEAHNIDPSGLPVGSPACEMAPVDWSRDQIGSSTDAYPWAPVQTANVDERARRSVGQNEAERTGLLFEVPSPTRGLRRSLYSRVAYQPAPRFDDGRLSHGPGNIHPIDERDEYEEGNGDGDPLDGPGNLRGRDTKSLYPAAILDPFRDTRESSSPPSPESPTQARELEVQSWVNDWAAADALMHQNAVRVPADKNNRTSSTLSDRSTRSTISANSYLQAGSSVSRSLSQRSSVFLGTRPLSSHNDPTITIGPSESQANPKLPPGYKQNHRRTRSLTLFTGSRGANSTTPNNKSPTKSFPQLQLESEALLGGYHIPGESSPTKLQNRARGWMGSVRRAFVGGTDRSSEGSTKRSGSLTSPPMKDYHHSINTTVVPRRAASTGAMLWKKKQGAKDWDIEDGRNDLKPSDLAMSYDDGDWDIESAVERRVVQVMFTVPREKLRVVNGGPDGDGVSTFSAEWTDKEEGFGPGKEKNRNKGDDEVE